MIKKKLLSLLLVIAMVMGILPFGEIEAYATKPTVGISRMVINSFITIGRNADGTPIYQDGKLKVTKERFIDIRGTGFMNAGATVKSVRVYKNAAKTEEVDIVGFTVETSARITVKVDPTSTDSIASNITYYPVVGYEYQEGSEIKIDTAEIAGGKLIGKIPDINGVDKYSLNLNQTLKIDGSNLKDSNIYLKEGSSSSEKFIPKDNQDNYQIITVDGVTTGLKDVYIRNGNSDDETTATATATLVNGIEVFPVPSVVNVEDISPTAGPVTGGTKVRITGTGLSANMLVQFGDRRATVESLEDKDGKKVLTVITPPQEITGIKDIYIDGSQKGTFQYIGIDNYLILKKVDPEVGNALGGDKISIYGYNFQNTKTEGSGETAKAVSDEDSYELSSSKTKLVLTKNSLTGTAQPSTEAKIRKREIEVLVDGKYASFNIELNLEQNAATSIDEKTREQILKVITPPAGAITNDTKVNIDVRITSRYYPDGTTEFKEANELTTFRTIEGSSIEFTYETVKTPVVKTITPAFGPASTISGEKSQVVASISGSNFLVQNKLIGEDYQTESPKVFLVPRVTTDEEIKSAINQNLTDFLKLYQAELKDNKVYLEKSGFITAVDGIVDKLGTDMTVILPKSGTEVPQVRDLVIVNPDGGFLRVNNAFNYKADNTNPKILSVTPLRANAQGGDQILVKGTGINQYKEGFVLTVDGKVVTVDKLENKVEDSGNIQEITFKAPKGSVGRKIVQVLNEDGGMDSYSYYTRNVDGSIVDGDSEDQDFFYTRVTSEPKIDVIAPSYGGVGTNVIIKGSDFKVGEGSNDGTSVYFNGYKIEDKKDGAEFKVEDNSTIKITMPSGLPLGFKDVIVENPDTARATVKNGFNYLSPQSRPDIIDISPSYGTINGGTIVKITGSGFTDRVEVFFGEKKGLDPIVNGDGTEIRVTTPDYPVSTATTDKADVDVTVMNYDGGSETKDDGFQYRVPGSFPKISKIDPNKGTTAGDQTVIITGEDFRYKDVDKDGKYTEKDVDGNPIDEIPKVYFGGEEVKTVKYAGQSQLIVTTPVYMKAEKVDVIIVNPDAGTAIVKGGYTYEKSKPTVESVTPPYIDKNGKTVVTVKGKGFIDGDYDSVIAQESKSEISIDLEAIFGSQAGSTTIVGGYGEVSVGNIKVVYDSQNPQNIQIVSSAGFETKSFTGKITTGKPLFISMKTSGDANVNEGIKVSMEGTKMTVERRSSINVKWVDENTLEITSPPMDGVGVRDLAIRNRDGGEAKTKIEVKNPASEPIITDIEPKVEKTKELDGEKYYSVDSILEGGITFTIKGADFRIGAKVFIGDQEAEVVARGPNDDSLTVKSPKGKPEDLNRNLDILVVNTDGGIAHSSKGIGNPKAPCYYVYKEAESNPKVTKIDPNKGSAIGGERVVITGEDFRVESGVEVKFGDRKAEVIKEESNYKKLVVITPPSNIYGPVDVHIRNIGALGETVVEGGFTYTSAPVIIKLEPDLVYATGGDKVEIIGKGFQEGAKVTIGGEEVETKFIDQFKLEIITPKVDLPNGVDSIKKDVTVTNPDGGEATKKDGITFTRPFPMRPTGFEAEAQHGRMILLKWNKSNAIERYRIEISESENGPYRYLAESSDGQYMARDLKPGTTYYFRLWALNQYGQSQGFATANAKTKTDAEDNQSGEFEDVLDNESQVVESGGNITVNYAKNYTTEDYTHDFTASKYQNYRTITLNVPAKIINTGKGTLNLKHRDMEIKASLSMMKSSGETYSDDETLRVTITKLFDGEQSSSLKYAPVGYVAQKQGIKVEYTVGNGRNNRVLEKLNGIYMMTFVDRASLSSLEMYSYRPGETTLLKEQGSFKKVYSDVYRKEVYQLDSYIKRSGYYIPFGR